MILLIAELEDSIAKNKANGANPALIRAGEEALKNAKLRQAERERAAGVAGADEPSAMTRGFVNGLLKQNPGLTAEALEAAGVATGNQTLIDASVALRNMNLNPKGYDLKAKLGILDSLKAGDLDALGTSLGETFGPGAASTVPTIGGGAIGGWLGKRIGGPFGAAVGAAAGAFAPSYGLAVGDLYQQLKQEGVPKEGAAKAALKYGVAIAGINSALGPVAKLARKLGGVEVVKKQIIQGVAKRLIVEAGKGAAEEGLTEGVQQTISEAVAAVQTGKWDLWKRGHNIVEAAVGGAIVGGPIAGGHAFVEGGHAGTVFEEMRKLSKGKADLAEIDAAQAEIEAALKSGDQAAMQTATAKSQALMERLYGKPAPEPTVPVPTQQAPSTFQPNAPAAQPPVQPASTEPVQAAPPAPGVTPVEQPSVTLPVGDNVDLKNLSPRMTQTFQTVQDQLVKAGVPNALVTSAFRSQEHNKQVGGASSSQHLHGDAMDISLKGLSDEQAKTVVQTVLNTPGVNGFGYYPNSNSIHFDVREGSRAAWGTSKSGDSIGRGWPPWMTEQVNAWRGQPASASPGGGAPGSVETPSSTLPGQTAPASTGAPRLADQSIETMIREKATSAGIDPDYMVRMAQIESQGNPRAANPNSSAKGLYQFVDGTWQTHGSGDVFDAGANTDAAIRLTRENMDGLSKALGRNPEAWELYLAHQQGLGGAIKILGGDPNQNAASVLGADAVNNNGGNANMTLGEFRQLWQGKYNQTPGGAVGTSGGLPGGAAGTYRSDRD